jgi:hypothetical protein
MSKELEQIFKKFNEKDKEGNKTKLFNVIEDYQDGVNKIKLTNQNYVSIEKKIDLFEN